jgi:hypothetical protein
MWNGVKIHNGRIEKCAILAVVTLVFLSSSLLFLLQNAARYFGEESAFKNVREVSGYKDFSTIYLKTAASIIRPTDKTYVFT